MRQIPGVPLIYLHGNAPTLERPSALTERLTARISDGKTALSLHQKQIIAALREEIIGPKNEPLVKGRWQRKMRGGDEHINSGSVGIVAMEGYLPFERVVSL